MSAEDFRRSRDLLDQNLQHLVDQFRQAEPCRVERIECRSDDFEEMEKVYQPGKGRSLHMSVLGIYELVGDHATFGRLSKLAGDLLGQSRLILPQLWRNRFVKRHPLDDQRGFDAWMGLLFRFSMNPPIGSGVSRTGRIVRIGNPARLCIPGWPGYDEALDYILHKAKLPTALPRPILAVTPIDDATEDSRQLLMSIRMDLQAEGDDVPDCASSDTSQIRKSVARAAAAQAAILAARPDLDGDERAQHDWLVENGCESVYPEDDKGRSDIPSRDTFLRYLREYRKLTDGLVNSSRSGRETGRSIVRPDQI